MAAWLTWPAVYLVYLCIYVTTASQQEGFPTLKILVIGRTGSGKSTLINNILGREIVKVGHRFYPQTTTVSAYQVEISGVDVTACDTPGLRDASGQDEEYMKKIKASCSDPDLVIFCLNMDNTRWHNDDEEAIQTVTEYLGDGIWKHSVLALTFADKVIASGHPKEKQIFKQRITEIEQLFRGALPPLKFGIPRKVVSAVSAKGQKDLPGVSNWLTGLFVKCLSQVRDSGKLGLLQIIVDRMEYSEDINADEFRKPEHEQPLNFTLQSLCWLIKMNPGKWSGIILGTKVGSFFAAKLMGTVLGGVFGGPLGVMLGGLMGYSVDQILLNFSCSDFESGSNRTKGEL